MRELTSSKQPLSGIAGLSGPTMICTSIWWLYLAQLKKVLREFSITTKIQIVIIIAIYHSLFSTTTESLREGMETADGIGADIGVLVGIV